MSNILPHRLIGQRIGFGPDHLFGLHAVDELAEILHDELVSGRRRDWLMRHRERVEKAIDSSYGIEMSVRQLLDLLSGLVTMPDAGETSAT